MTRSFPGGFDDTDTHADGGPADEELTPRSLLHRSWRAPCRPGCRAGPLIRASTSPESTAHSGASPALRAAPSTVAPSSWAANWEHRSKPGRLDERPRHGPRRAALTPRLSNAFSGRRADCHETDICLPARPQSWPVTAEGGW